MHSICMSIHDLSEMLLEISGGGASIVSYRTSVYGGFRKEEDRPGACMVASAKKRTDPAGQL